MGEAQAPAEVVVVGLAVASQPLGKIRPTALAPLVRRMLGEDQRGRQLPVAAFNSSI